LGNKSQLHFLTTLMADFNLLQPFINYRKEVNY
jgi:hypothetical protein